MFPETDLRCYKQLDYGLNIFKTFEKVIHFKYLDLGTNLIYINGNQEEIKKRITSGCKYFLIQSNNEDRISVSYYAINCYS